MAFPYSQQTWTDGVSSASAARLTVIEQGIALAGVTGTSSSPPGSPTDGMIWRLPADSSNGRYWFFQYDSSQTTNKWVFMGGSPMTAEVDTAETRANTAFGDLATAGPSITVPRAGDYYVEFGMACSNNTATDGCTSSISVGGGAPSTNDGIFHTSATANASGTPARSQIFSGLSASNVLKMQYATITAGTGTFQFRWLKITPIRVI